MDKRLIFSGNTERRDLFFLSEDRNYLRKHAQSYHPKVAAYIEKAKPMPDLVQVLLTALGAYDTWGQNVNGDRFRDPALAHEGDDYGYQTFKSNANYFTHHVNSDPALAKGKVLHSVWNEKAKRVELVVGIDINLDPEAIAAVDRGDSLAFSMGSKVPFDVCSICGNRAKTRADYCEHLRYMMNQMDPMTGKLVGADNLYPRFFDISRVLIPADKTAYMWTKVASAAGENPFSKLSSAYLATVPSGKLNDLKYLQEKVAELQDGNQKPSAITKKSAVVKDAEITKRIPVMKEETLAHLDKIVPPTQALLEATSPSLPPAVLAELKRIAPSLGNVLSTAILLGITPKADELEALGVGSECPALSPDLYLPELAEALLPFLAQRSYARPHLVRRVVGLANALDNGDHELSKKAQTIGDVMAEGRTRYPSVVPRPPQIHPGFLVGMAAALYALFGPHAGPLASKFGRHLADHPLIYAALAATALASANQLSGAQNAGIYDVDSTPHPLYNNLWQSRFAQMQARPVTVIKTGAVDTEVAKKVYYGLPLIYAGSQVARVQKARNDARGQRTGPITQFVAEHPELAAGGMFAEHYLGRPISKHVAKAVEGAKRIVKHASIRDLEFLDCVPEEDKPLFWDLAILDASARIAKKLGG